MSVCVRARIHIHNYKEEQKECLSSEEDKEWTISVCEVVVEVVMILMRRYLW